MFGITQIKIIFFILFFSVTGNLAPPGLPTRRRSSRRLSRKLRRNNVGEKLLVTFYRSTIESVLKFCISVWFSQCTEAERKKLQGVVNTAQRITGCPLPSLKDIYISRCLSRAERITKDSSHPGFHLFDLMPSGRRYRSIRTRSSRFRDSFFPKAVSTLNTHMH